LVLSSNAHTGASMELVEALERLALVGTPIDSEISSSSSSSTRRKRASVLIPILSNGTILLTQRNRKLRSHGGQVCFPGGRQDDDDNGDDVQTALREAREEVGLDDKSVRPIGRLPALISQHGLCVTPIIGRVVAKDDDNVNDADALVDSLVLSKDEVDAVFVVPLEYFADDANLSRPVECIAWHGDTFEMRTYEYTYQNRSFTIWGLTAYIAHQVASVATFRGQGRLRRYCCRPKEDHHATKTAMTTMPVARWQSGHFSVHQDGEFLIHEELHDHNDRIASSEGHSGRLSLKRIQVHAAAQQIESTAKREHVQPAHSFQVQDLDGGQIWRLAADNETQRLQWIAYLHWSSMKLKSKGRTAAS
jgi:8-oxo-dGTP pyrophosphatase MutT (NUDIX family)